LLIKEANLVYEVSMALLFEIIFSYLEFIMSSLVFKVASMSIPSLKAILQLERLEVCNCLYIAKSQSRSDYDETDFR
jgi:hypothetical protein